MYLQKETKKEEQEEDHQSIGLGALVSSLRMRRTHLNWVEFYLVF